jgi:hypothetical protein
MCSPEERWLNVGTFFGTVEAAEVRLAASGPATNASNNVAVMRRLRTSLSFDVHEMLHDARVATQWSLCDFLSE